MAPAIANLSQLNNALGRPATSPRRHKFPVAKAIAATIVTFFLFAATSVQPAHAQLFDYFWPPSSLDTVVEGISERYSDVTHMTTRELAQSLAQDENIILVDVREPDEFKVSRIEGALRADPGATPDDLDTNITHDVTGKSVVFYCSVGERSSLLARRAKSRLMSKGAKAVYNLSGGIFAWHNEKRDLVDTTGQTPYVHPFDSHWGRYVERNELTRMSPVPNE